MLSRQHTLPASNLPPHLLRYVTRLAARTAGGTAARRQACVSEVLQVLHAPHVQLLLLHSVVQSPGLPQRRLHTCLQTQSDGRRSKCSQGCDNHVSRQHGQASLCRWLHGDEAESGLLSTVNCLLRPRTNMGAVASVLHAC